MRIARPTEAPPPLPELSSSHTEAAAPARKVEGASFSNVLHKLGREIERGEAMSSRALRGGDLSGSELLALQAGIYRYSEAVELTTKLVDRVTGAVKTTLQSQ